MYTYAAIYAHIRGDYQTIKNILFYHSLSLVFLSCRVQAGQWSVHILPACKHMPYAHTHVLHVTRHGQPTARLGQARLGSLARAKPVPRPVPCLQARPRPGSARLGSKALPVPRPCLGPCLAPSPEGLGELQATPHSTRTILACVSNKLMPQ